MLGAITQNPIGIGEQVVASAMKAIKARACRGDRHRVLLVRQEQRGHRPKIKAVLYQ